MYLGLSDISEKSPSKYSLISDERANSASEENILRLISNLLACYTGTAYHIILQQSTSIIPPPTG